MWITLLLLLSSASQASEIDDITTYYEPLASSDAALDAHVAEAMAGALAKDKDCDIQAFGREVAGRLVSMRFYSGATERFAWNSPAVARIKKKMGDSIYSGTPFAHSVVGFTYGLDPVIQMAGVKIGTDKLGHFIDHGHSLFQRFQGGESIEQLAARAQEEEEGAFGFATTGVKSYADMVANLDGFSFWRDVYGLGSQAYVRCEGGKLRAARPFHFRDYVTPAWNEATNCNAYNGDQISLPSLDEVQIYLENHDLPAEACDDAYGQMKAATAGQFTKAVLSNLMALEARERRRYRCPIERDRCEEMMKVYGERFGLAVRRQILSPECRAQALGHPSGEKKGPSPKEEPR